MSEIKVAIRKLSLNVKGFPRPMPFTDALITDGDRRLSSRQPGWDWGEEYFRQDYIRNAREKRC